MSLSLYQITVPTYLQGLGGVETYMKKGLEHCAEKGVDPQTIVETTLFDDMWAFDKQVQSICHHSLGAIRGVQNGVFNPPTFQAGIDYDGLASHVAKTREELESLNAADVDGLSGKEMRFEAGERKLPFVAEDFMMSFSFPNFFFHATTAYDILRHRGVPIGKRHYMGRMRMKTD